MEVAPLTPGTQAWWSWRTDLINWAQGHFFLLLLCSDREASSHSWTPGSGRIGRLPTNSGHRDQWAMGMGHVTRNP
jgi:hypothetical protein